MPFAIDLFCGAGGFSEGILQAGFDILFSSDKSSMVQETYTNRHKQLGLIEGIDTHFELNDIRDVTKELVFDKINSLKYGNIFNPGDVDVIFGGPPCQGFSRLGKRDSKDPRNMLFHEYLRLIRDIKPKYVVMENVKGILDMSMLDFPSVVGETYLGQHLVPEILRNELEQLGYVVLDIQVLNAADFGVPQQRNRAIFLAYREDVYPIQYPAPTEERVTIYDALGGLYTGDREYYSDYSIQSSEGRTPTNHNGAPIMAETITNMETSNHSQSVVSRFALYREGENKNKAVKRIQSEGLDLLNIAPSLFYETLFQLNSVTNSEIIHQELIKLMGERAVEFSNLWWVNTNKQLNQLFITEIDNLKNDTIISLSRRLELDYDNTLLFWNNIRDRLNTEITIQDLDNRLRKGQIDDEIAIALFTKKNIRIRLNSQGISPTMVTLPDDFIHPYFNRVLTVREMARLQSFDDSFEFLGKRTTGGNKRALETPQFTQVGNAVPPLLAKAVAQEVMRALERG